MKIFKNLTVCNVMNNRLTVWLDRPAAEVCVDHSSQKPKLVDLIILGTGSFQMSWSHTEVYRSSRHLMMSEICHLTDSLVPSSGLETFLQHHYNNKNYISYPNHMQIQSTTLFSTFTTDKSKSSDDMEESFWEYESGKPCLPRRVGRTGDWTVKPDWTVVVELHYFGLGRTIGFQAAVSDTSGGKHPESSHQLTVRSRCLWHTVKKVKR